MKNYQTYNGAHPDIKINVLDYLPKDRYLLALRRLRQEIAKGRPLVAYDDDTPGNKSSGCSWGLCDETKEIWPDAQDHTFPVDFERHGRMTALSPESDLCPMDKRQEGGPSGCFYSCRVFQSSRKQPAPNRAEALKLFDEAIAKAQT